MIWIIGYQWNDTNLNNLLHLVMAQTFCPVHEPTPLSYRAQSNDQLNFGVFLFVLNRLFSWRVNYNIMQHGRTEKHYRPCKSPTLTRHVQSGRTLLISLKKHGDSPDQKPWILEFEVSKTIFLCWEISSITNFKSWSNYSEALQPKIMFFVHGWEPKRSTTTITRSKGPFRCYGWIGSNNVPYSMQLKDRPFDTS